MTKNTFVDSNTPNFMSKTTMTADTNSAVNINHSNNYYSNFQIIRSVNGKPVTQNELISDHMISKGGAMKIILAARRRIMEEAQLNGNQNFTN